MVWIGLHGVYVNSSIMDEVVLLKKPNPLHVKDHCIPIESHHTDSKSLMIFSN